MTASEIPFRIETTGLTRHDDPPSRRVLAVGRAAGGGGRPQMSVRWGDIAATGQRPGGEEPEGLAAIKRAGREAWRLHQQQQSGEVAS